MQGLPCGSVLVGVLPLHCWAKRFASVRLCGLALVNFRTPPAPASLPTLSSLWTERRTKWSTIQERLLAMASGRRCECCPTRCGLRSCLSCRRCHSGLLHWRLFLGRREGGSAQRVLPRKLPAGPCWALAGRQVRAAGAWALGRSCLQHRWRPRWRRDLTWYTKDKAAQQDAWGSAKAADAALMQRAL